MLLGKKYVLYTYNAIFLSSQQNTKQISIYYSINWCSLNYNFWHVTIWLLNNGDCRCHTGITLSLRVRYMILALNIYSKGFPCLNRHTFFAWFFMFTVVGQFFNEVFKTLVVLLFLAVCTSLIIRMIACFNLIFYYTIWHAFETLHVRRMNTLLSLLNWTILLLLLLFNLKLPSQTINTSCSLPVIAFVSPKVHD